jgi:hypothetical protein
MEEKVSSNESTMDEEIIDLHQSILPTVSNYTQMKLGDLSKSYNYVAVDGGVLRVSYDESFRESPAQSLPSSTQSSTRAPKSASPSLPGSRRNIRPGMADREKSISSRALSAMGRSGIVNQSSVRFLGDSARGSSRFSVKNIKDRQSFRGAVKKPTFTQVAAFSESPYDGEEEKFHDETLVSKLVLGEKPGSLILYVDLEHGEEFYSEDKFLDRKRFRPLLSPGHMEVDDSGDIEKGEMVTEHMEIDSRLFRPWNEISGLGETWRAAFQRVLLRTLDKVNAVRVTRFLQFFMVTQTGYEAYLMERLVVALDSLDRKAINIAMAEAMKNRNVSRILLRTSRVTWDYQYHSNNLIRFGRYLDSFQQIFFFTGKYTGPRLFLQDDV